MPVFYKIYPVSQKDVSTLYNILKYIKFFKMKDILLILDRGFYSAKNLDEMAEITLKFLIPLTPSNNLFFSLVRSNKTKLSDYRNAFLFQEEVLFLTTDSVKLKNKVIQAHLYFNQQQFTEQSS